MSGRFTLYPAKYVRVVNFREVPVGVRVEALLGKGLTKGSLVTLTCMRKACRGRA